VQFSQDTGIKKVRCKTRIQTPIEIAPNPRNPLTVTRYLNPEDYFAAIVWEIPPSKEGRKPKFEAQYIRRTEVDKAGKPIELKPHPAAKKACTIHKDDYIEFSEDGIWKKARVAGFSATQNKLDIRPVYSTGSVKDWIIATQTGFVGKGWKFIDGQYYMSINVLFGSLSARKITVSPIGKVFRKK
jgi:CRISPR-associated endonuclease Csn1